MLEKHIAQLETDHERSLLRVVSMFPLEKYSVLTAKIPEGVSFRHRSLKIKRDCFGDELIFDGDRLII